MTLTGFSLKMDVLGKRLPAAINAHMRKVFLAVDQAVVLATPVDTGYARSNWIATIGSPESSTISPHAPGDNLGIGERGNANGAMSQASSVAANRNPDDVMYLANNVNYIGRLNAGSSAQAPANFVEKGMIAGVVASKAHSNIIATVNT